MRKLLLGSFLLAATSSAWADSYWNHNGSLMRLVANGNSRAFVYVDPRDVLVRAGVRPGALLFSGARIGNRYSGTAYVFSRECAEPLGYAVAGDVLSETHVVLYGTREVYAAGCRPTGRYTTDRLEFTYRYSD